MKWAIIALFATAGMASRSKTTQVVQADVTAIETLEPKDRQIRIIGGEPGMWVVFSSTECQYECQPSVRIDAEGIAKFEYDPTRAMNEDEKEAYAFCEPDAIECFFTSKITNNFDIDIYPSTCDYAIDQPIEPGCELPIYGAEWLPVSFHGDEVAEVDMAAYVNAKKCNDMTKNQRKPTPEEMKSTIACLLHHCVDSDTDPMFSPQHGGPGSICGKIICDDPVPGPHGEEEIWGKQTHGDHCPEACGKCTRTANTI